MSDLVPAFLFTCCQVGAEKALKAEIAERWPTFRFAYSRPGFLTFKLPAEDPPPTRFDLKSIFARTYGFSLGKVVGEDAGELAAQTWQLVGDRPIKHVHVWQRDSHVPGNQGFWPGVSLLAKEVSRQIADAAPIDPTQLYLNQYADTDDPVLDCVLVEPNEWWIGYHEASSSALRWPGGVVPVTLPAHAVSRAYGKMDEMLEWSRFPLLPGDQCIEIGSAPGGAAQALLDRGAIVTGVDPAEMDERVIDQEGFTWIRKRGSDLKRRDYAGFRWLATDINMVPKFTLDMLEDIVNHEGVNIQGLLLTLKLLKWELATEIPTHLERIRSWGYSYVRARQLASNRQEICVVALKSRSLRRGRPKR